MESTRVFVDNVDTYLSRIPAIIAQQKVQELRSLSRRSNDLGWVSPEQHGI
ncbi:hypothetical protein V1520DRAFT_358995, partial [Lipomyces starkeyi]